MKKKCCVKKKSVLLPSDSKNNKNEAMTKLSVNINKVATLRNARGGNTPDVVRFAIDCEKLGAQG